MPSSDNVDFPVICSWCLCSTQVPTDIIGQLRFLNEGNRARKNRGRGAKKFFSSKVRGVSKLLDDDLPRIQWIDLSADVPPVRALVTVSILGKPSLEMIKVTDETLAEHILLVWYIGFIKYYLILNRVIRNAILPCPSQLAGVDLSRFFLVERGGNIGKSLCRPISPLFLQFLSQLFW